MWRKLLIACLLCLTGIRYGMAQEAGSSLSSHVASSMDARRIALVIGNGDYANEPLGNAIRDARAFSKTLQSFGFEVTRYENLDHSRMQQALLAFQRRLDSGGIGLFYFAGHGMRVANRTLLLPVDADPRAPARLLADSVALDSVLRDMSAPRPGKLNLVILDTCLNNPFRTAQQPIGPAPDNTLIAYATAPGSFAADGARHGIYTAALLRAMRIPDQNVGQLFQQVATSVRRATGRTQNPVVFSSLPADGFRFGKAVRTPVSAVDDDIVIVPRSRGILPKDSAEQYELAFWDSIKDSNHPGDYEAYLQTYPNGRFAALARARLERLRSTEKPATKAAPEPPHQPAASKPAPQHPRPAPAAAPPEEKPAAGPVTAHAIKDCTSCPELIALPPGSFTMGSNTSDPSEKPAHRVTIAKPFAIGKYEVTVGQWDACVDAGGCQQITTDANRAKKTPARDVSWDDAQQYAKWLSKTTGQSYRLPTEAEWEYAARGGTTTRFWWGEQMRKGKANCKGCGNPWQQEAPNEVGSFPPNPWGLYDMNGSVWEWVSDCWHNNYKGAPASDRSWDEQSCRMRVIRGGSWREDPSYMPVTTRFKYDASVRYLQNGFRVARDIK